MQKGFAGRWRRIVGGVLAAGVWLAGTALGRPPVPLSPARHLAAAEFRAQSLRDEQGRIPTNALANAVRQKLQMRASSPAWPGTAASGSTGRPRPRNAGLDPAAWTWLGPGNIGGRIRAILVHPVTPEVMWVGGVGGGVWKSLDAGASWFPLDDFMANLAVACLVLDPTNPDVLYAGTGEGFSNADALRGAGIFKSLDGGMTWGQLPATATASFYFVNRLAIAPDDPLVLLAATGTGIWRSTDGGVSWSQRYSTAPILDLAFDPTDSTKAIASGSTFSKPGGAFYSVDGGVTWAAASGLPTAGRVEVAYAPSNPSVVYASVNNNQGEVYLSIDGGATYAQQSTGYHYLSGQGWYDNAIWVDPTDANVLVVGGLDLWRSTNGGLTLAQISQWFSAPASAHADQHCIVAHPAFDGLNNRTVYFANDGGLYRATDVYTVAPTSGWTELNNNLGITEFYGGAGNAGSGVIIGGSQDNGTLRYSPANGPNGWTSMFGGDGGFCAADPTNPSYFYGEYIYLQIHRSSDGGQSSHYISGGIGDAGVPGGGGDPDGEGPNGDPDSSANFIAPFILDPNSANTLLAGGSNLWRSLNAKASSPAWTNIKPGANGSFISAVAVAPGSSDIIWVGHNNGNVYSTSNGTAANPTWTRLDRGAPGLPSRACTRLTIDPADADRVYATFGGYSAGNVYGTTNGGLTWQNLAGGLPAAPVHSLVIAPFNRNYLYVGTEVGVFGSADAGATWSPGNEGAANVAVDELFWLGSDLVAATHGRGMFKIQLSGAAVLALAASQLLDENCQPANAEIDPGETVVVQFTLTNLVNLPTANLVATLLATNGVMSPGLPQTYGSITGHGTAARAFAFTASGQCGDIITATLRLQDGTNDLGVVTASFGLGTPIITFAENFDAASSPSLPAGWTVDWTGGGAAWAVAGGGADTAPNCAHAPEPTSISDNRLTSPPIAVISPSARLSFRHQYNTEFPYDGGVLEIAIGGGAFTDILTAGGRFLTNGYVQTIAGDDDNPLSGRAAWTGNSGGYVTTVVNLPDAAAGQSIQLRWRFGTDTGTGSSGWSVDTIALVDNYLCCTGALLPSILSEPQDLTVYAGETASFRVISAGDAPLNYQWSANGTNLVDGGSVAGAQSNLLTIAAVHLSDAGPYSATVSNAIGGTVSRVATLAVVDRPALQAVRDAGGGIKLGWSAIAGRNYQVQYRTNLATGGWTGLDGGFTAGGTNGAVVIPLGAEPQRYYRVVALP